MNVLRDSASIRDAVTNFPEVAPFLATRLEELAEYDDYELDQLVNVFIVEARDSLAEVDAALGFDLERRAADAIDSHPGWYEFTYVLGDDGFGVVLYVPKDAAIDPRLRELCEANVRSSQEQTP
jgi:hypothetical protein